MFRIDSDAVVDATMAGGPARYINHSCDVSYIFLFVILCILCPSSLSY